MFSTLRQVFLATTVVTVVCVSIVGLVVYHINVPEDRAFKLAVSIPLTMSMTVPFSYFLGLQAYRVQELAAELKHLVERDRLTDLGTRDYFFSQMEEHPESFGVSLMIDIDHFKKINDSHGHLCGDVVIRRVAQLIADNCREMDIVARFGGEEFVVFLRNSSPENGEQTARRIRQAVEDAEIVVNDTPIAVTVSIGGSLKSATQDIERAIKEADDALYRAKEAGRNRAVLAWIETKVRAARTSISPLLRRDMRG